MLGTGSTGKNSGVFTLVRSVITIALVAFIVANWDAVSAYLVNIANTYPIVIPAVVAIAVATLLLIWLKWTLKTIGWLALVLLVSFAILGFCMVTPAS